VKLQCKNACGSSQIAGLNLGKICAGGIDEGSNDCGGRNRFVQELQPFRSDL
jgi:hypothetical protein